MTCRYRWHVEPSETPSTGEVLVEPGTKQLVPIRFPMPAAHTGDHRAGDATIVASFDFGDDNVQSDTFALDAIQPVNGRPQQIEHCRVRSEGADRPRCGKSWAPASNRLTPRRT